MTEPLTPCQDPDNDPEMWFPAKNDFDTIAQAVGFCYSGCHMRAECLESALQAETGTAGRRVFGIFGGLTERERIELQQARGQETTTPQKASPA